MSPAERVCPDCIGFNGRSPDDIWKLCPRCKGLGRIWLDGGPSFGCRGKKMTLAERSIGEVVELGTGHVGRIVQSSSRYLSVTYLTLIDEWTGIEDKEPTCFPGEVGVRHVRKYAQSRTGGKGDHLDPLNQKKAL